MSPKKKERKIIKRSPLSLFQRIEEAVRKRTESDYQNELERERERDVRGIIVIKRGIEEFFRQTGPTVLHREAFLERIATPRKDHRHSERRARATSGLRVSGTVIGNL